MPGGCIGGSWPVDVYLRACALIRNIGVSGDEQETCRTVRTVRTVVAVVAVVAVRASRARGT